MVVSDGGAWPPAARAREGSADGGGGRDRGGGRRRGERGGGQASWGAKGGDAAHRERVGATAAAETRSRTARGRASSGPTPPSPPPPVGAVHRGPPVHRQAGGASGPRGSRLWEWGGGGGVDAGCWGPLRFSAHPPPPPPRSHSHPPSPRPLREVARVLTPRGCVSNRACGRGPCRGSGPAVGNLRLASGHVRGARGGAAEQAPTSFHVARAPRRAGGLSRLGSAAACTATTVVLRWGRVGTGLEEKACAYFITYPRRMPWGLAMGFLGEEAQGGWSPPL